MPDGFVSIRNEEVYLKGEKGSGMYVAFLDAPDIWYKEYIGGD